MPFQRAVIVQIFLSIMVLTAILSGVGLSSSLWLDETITGWISRGEFSRVAELTSAYQGQSPLYYWIIWLLVSLFGSSEVVLRLPSVGAGILSLLIFYRIARRDFVPVVALTATLVLLANGSFVRALVSARPYSLALLFGIIAFDAIDRRIRYGSGLRQAAAAVLASFYMHYLIGVTAAVVCAGRFFLASRGSTRCVSRIEWVSLAILLAGAVPGLAHLISLSGRSTAYRFSESLSAKTALGAFAPVDALSIFLLSFLVVVCFAPRRLIRFLKPERELVVTTALWALLPPLVLAAASLAGGAPLLVGRYCLFAAPGVALLCGVLLSGLVEERARMAVAWVVLLIMILIPRQWHPELWRETAQALRASDELTLVSTGLIEAEQTSWLQESRNREYLTAPLQFYPVSGPVFPVSRKLDQAYLTATIFPLLASRDAVRVVVANRPGEGEQKSPVLERYTELLSSQGFTRLHQQYQGLLVTATFSRQSSAQP